MQIGIISDTHGSLSAWELALQNCFQTADLIIHCGDVLYHGPRNPLPEGYDPAKLALTLNQLGKSLVIVKGNCDAEVDQMVLDYPLESPYAHVLTPARRILAHHGHGAPSQKFSKKLFHPLGGTPIIISGHTHIPEIQIYEDFIQLNPGSPSLPKSASGEKTVAIIDERRIAILNISNGQPLQQYFFPHKADA